jgi:enamine deaminase RidA (YjgF/YER057c/UK114 family)
MDAERRIADAGIHLPPVVAPVASYVPVVRSGDLLFVSGQVPLSDGTLTLSGKLGELSVEDGAAAARRCALQALAAIRAELGTLDRVRRVVRVTVFVASAPGFVEQSKVANGASDALHEVFGEMGRHARTAIGVAELPLGAPVEVEVLVEVQDTERTSGSA